MPKSKSIHAVTVRETARRLGCSDDTIHEGLISRKLPFGVALKMPSGRFKYIIMREALDRWCADPGGYGKELAV